MVNDGYLFMSVPDVTCTHVVKDRKGSFCGKDLSLIAQQSGEIKEERRERFREYKLIYCKACPRECPLMRIDAREYFEESKLSRIK